MNKDIIRSDFFRREALTVPHICSERERRNEDERQTEGDGTDDDSFVPRTERSSLQWEADTHEPVDREAHDQPRGQKGRQCPNAEGGDAEIRRRESIQTKYLLGFADQVRQ